MHIQDQGNFTQTLYMNFSKNEAYCLFFNINEKTAELQSRK